MDPQWATVVSALGAATIAGAVAIISAYLTSRRAAAEAAANRADSAQNRHNALLVHVMPKQLDAIETIWWHLYRAELDSALSDDDLQRVGRALVWVTEPVREACLRFLLIAGETSKSEDFERTLRAARASLLDLARVAKLDDALLGATQEELTHV